MSGEFLIAQAVGLYERDSDQEKLKIPGPIKHDITVNVRKAYILRVIRRLYLFDFVQVLVRGKKNPGIKYEYTLAANSTVEDSFTWKLGDWAACSATCGGGKQRRISTCFQADKGTVDDENCWSNANNTRPSEMTRMCNKEPCPAHWWVGPWQLCPVTCKRHSKQCLS